MEILSERKKILQLGPKETALFEECRQYQDREEQHPEHGRFETIWYQTVHFGMDNGCLEADVKLCNGNGGPWMEMVVFQDGCELSSSEVNDVGFGPLTVDYDGERFEVDVAACDGKREIGVYDA